MIFLAIIIATILITTWLVLLSRVTREDWILAAEVKIYDNRVAIRKLTKAYEVKKEKIRGYSGFAYKIMTSIIVKNPSKSIDKLTQKTACLSKENLKGLNPLIMPGYVIIREVEAIGKSSIHKAILSKCFEYYGKKYAPMKAKQLMANLLSLPVFGIFITLVFGVILLGIDSTTGGLAVIFIGTIIILVLAYAMYDELNDKVKKRQKAISGQFPGVVSKLALLVTSGMIMDRAWRETAFSQDSEIYHEMRRTSKELENLVSPEIAYSGFINRCNTKESAKLASAIIQNLYKGNAEIGRLLKNMAREAWQERRHTAKRDAEKANSKLMIPTMMLFLAILVMLMVPVAMNFSGI